MRRRAALAAFGLLMLAVEARADDRKIPQVVTGTWFATGAPGQVWSGTWSAELYAGMPNDALGSWTLTNEMGEVLVQGTWSARRAGKGWRGAWSARVAKSKSLLSGTWDADEKALKDQKTFADMLRHAGETQIGGTWKLKRAHGSWWLRPRR